MSEFTECRDECIRLRHEVEALQRKADRARYLAVYGAMVAAQVSRGDIDDFGGMRHIVAYAHDVARRSEDAQP